MTSTALLVDAVGLVAIAVVARHFWWPRAGSERAVLTNGVQSALIVVKGGYTPDTIVLERHRPARLVFRREEHARCSEHVLLPAFDRAAALPPGQEVTIDFVPRERGEFPFMCAMGMLRGRIVVE